MFDAMVSVAMQKIVYFSSWLVTSLKNQANWQQRLILRNKPLGDSNPRLGDTIVPPSFF